jgi:hypothetical protein
MIVIVIYFDGLEEEGALMEDIRMVFEETDASGRLAALFLFSCVILVL